MTRFWSLALLLPLLCLALPHQAANAEESYSPTHVGRAVKVGTAPTIWELQKQVKPPKAFGIEKEVYNESMPGFLRHKMSIETKADPLSTKFLAQQAPAPNLSIDGYANQDNANLLGFRVSPPDVNGDVGVNFYVQYINLGWIFFNKSTGAVAGGPFAGNIFWQGFGGVCESNNAGDPIVIFDHVASRWIFSQFTDPANSDGHQCFAVTQGSDPAGPYHLYDFLVSPGEFNDYPKIGLWTDGAGQSSYVMSSNNFAGSFSGVQVHAFR